MVINIITSELLLSFIGMQSIITEFIGLSSCFVIWGTLLELTGIRVSSMQGNFSYVPHVVIFGKYK